MINSVAESSVSHSQGMLLNRRPDNPQFSLILLAIYRSQSKSITFPIDLERGRAVHLQILKITLQNSAVIPELLIP
jgi:hypothetical protein